MKSIATAPLTPPAASHDAGTWTPRFPRGLLRNIAVDMAFPWIALQVLTHAWGFSDVSAFALAAIFPAASLLANWRRRRHVDYIGLVAVVVLLGGVFLALITHDIRFALLKPAIAAAAFGIACLATLGRRRPLMFYFARQLTAGDDAAKIAAWDARLDTSTGFRRAMRVLTLVWGMALMIKAAAWTVVALWLPPGAAIVVGPLLGIGLFLALITWSIAYGRRGAARLAASAASGAQETAHA
jgi:hypothetical protein